MARAPLLIVTRTYGLGKTLGYTVSSSMARGPPEGDKRDDNKEVSKTPWPYVQRVQGVNVLLEVTSSYALIPILEIHVTNHV